MRHRTRPAPLLVPVIAGLFFASAFFLLAYSTVGSPDLRIPFYASAPALAVAAFLAVREVFFRGVLQQRLGLLPTAVLFAISLPLLYVNSYAAYAIFSAYLLLEGLLLGVIRQRYGLPSCVLFAELHLLFFVLSQASRYALSAVLPLLLLAFPFVLLARSDAQLRGALQSLGLKQVRWSDARTGALGTLLLMAVTFTVVSVASALGSADIENVRRIVSSAPLPARVLSFTLTPLAEETFFRGFLQPRFGILPQSAAFAFFHFGYGSITEVAGALSAGIVLGLLYKKTGSLAVPIVAHTLYNFLAIAVMASA